MATEMKHGLDWWPLHLRRNQESRMLVHGILSATVLSFDYLSDKRYVCMEWSGVMCVKGVALSIPIWYLDLEV